MAGIIAGEHVAHGCWIAVCYALSIGKSVPCGWLKPFYKRQVKNKSLLSCKESSISAQMEFLIWENSHHPVLVFLFVNTYNVRVSDLAAKTKV